MYQSTNSLNNFALVEWIQAIWGSKSLTNFVLRSKCEWGVGRSDLKVQSDESEEVRRLRLVCESQGFFIHGFQRFSQYSVENMAYVVYMGL